MKRIDFDAELLALIRSLPRNQRREIGEAIAAAQEAFGQPHRHGGIGLRKLRDEHYEIRLGLGQRMVFEETEDALYLKLLGTHRDVSSFLKRH